MFSFDGAYRRTPIQSLGGASRSSDRDTLIRKAAEERQKRADIRRQNNGATLIQSYARSFILRQRTKAEQRQHFDALLATKGALSDQTLELQLKRLLFFYYGRSRADAERLIQLGQFIVRSPAFLLQRSVTDRVWRMRLQRLLDLCTRQICQPPPAVAAAAAANTAAAAGLSQTIPFRMLETFTSAEQVERHVPDSRVVRDFLDSVFGHLVRREYFALLRQMLDEKVPPLDGAVQVAPNAISDTLLRMLQQPLRLVAEATDEATAESTAAGNRVILAAFVDHLLVPAFTPAVRSFVLPCLAVWPPFPFGKLLAYVDERLAEQQTLERRQQLQQQGGGEAGGDEEMDTSEKITGEGKPANQRPTSTRSCAKSAPASSPFLLSAVLLLDKQHQQQMLGDQPLLAAYIRVIAAMSGHLSRLPASKRGAAAGVYGRRTSAGEACDYWEVHEAAGAQADGDADEADDDDDDDDDEADHDEDSDEDNETADARRQRTKPTALETEVMLDVVCQLNDTMRTKLIAEHIEEERFLGNAEVLHCVCQICHHLMLYNRVAQRDMRLMSRLWCKPKFIRTLWVTLAQQSSQLRFSSPMSLLSRGIHIPQDDIRSVIPLLATFCSMFDQLIQTLHDGEFCQEDILPGAVSKIMPFTLAEIATISTGLKDISLGLVDLAFPETRRETINDHYRTVRQHQHNSSHTSLDQRASAEAAAERTASFHKIMWPHLLKVCVSLLRQLYTRDLRRGFCADGHWTVDTLNLPLDKPDDLHLTRGRRGPRPFQPIKDFTKEDFESGGPPLSTKQIRSITILREIPFVVPFNTRVGILQGLLSADKLRAQGDLQGFLHGPSIQLTVRRSHLYEDAFDKLRTENEPDLRPRFRIQMVNSIGLEEVGIDGGGVFREFLSELIKAAFDPNRGFFMITTDNKLYPNPAVGVIVPDFQKHYYFIGRILGKALYENLLVELPLAEFFLSKLAGKKSTVDVHQLASLDPVLHHNLLGLKSYDESGGDVAELGLDFTVVSNELGGARVEELIPNGANVLVTNANRMEYIRQMADYKLNRQIRQQCAAFRRGLSNVVTVEWLHMFSNKEFQVLISGAEIAVDVDDLEMNTKYGGDFGPEHATIRHFWEVLHGFNDLQRRQLLKFVTSCSRPPLLGFKDLDPPFCIQNAGDTDRLPSASTCMNLLKLPAFPTAALLREKLLYAIESGSGFELS